MKQEKTIDFHAHAVTNAFRESMIDLGIDPIEEDGFPLPAWSKENHLAFMNEAGIDYSILSAPVPHIYNGDDEKAAKWARKINEELAQIHNSDTEHFGFVSVLPLPNIQASIDEAIYGLDTLGALGVKVATNMGGYYLGDPIFTPLMEVLNQRHAMVIIHSCRARLRPDNVITGKVAAIFEYPADTTRAVLNMMAHKVLTTYPNIRWIVPHCGSFLPYMVQRFTGVSGILASMSMMEQIDAQEEFAKLYFDIAGDPEPTHLDMLRMVADDSHILYGSDYPHSPAPVILKKKKHLDENPKYDDIRQAIYSENAKDLGIDGD